MTIEIIKHISDNDTLTQLHKFYSLDTNLMVLHNRAKHGKNGISKLCECYFQWGLGDDGLIYSQCCYYDCYKDWYASNKADIRLIPLSINTINLLAKQFGSLPAFL